MTQRKKNSAVVWVYLKYMHPQKIIRDLYLNWTQHDKMEDLLIIGQGVKKIKGKEHMCALFRHDSFPNKVLYCCKKWSSHVVSEGDPTQSFHQVPAAVQEEVGAEEEDSDEVGAAIPDHVFHMGGNEEDIAHIRGLGFTVDDDNEPVPENIPDPNEEPNQAVEKETWG